MSGFDDLIPAAMPYLASEDLQGTAGSTWQWDYEVTDNTGTLVPFTGITGLCQMRATAGGTVVLAPTVTFPSAGVVRCAATAAASAIAVGRYEHEVELTRTSDSAKITVVGGGDSHFQVKAGN